MTRRTAGVLGLAFGGYLALSVVLWWGAWSSHPTSVTTCGCGDTSLFLWFLEWPAYALAHGHNPFYSSALFHPGGIDLLSNTSVLAVGIPLAPVTWIWGPVATLNVASTLAPALSALAMCWLLLRWVRWWPAAVVGGLAYGFSPFVFTNLAGAHLMTGVLVLLPLVVACLDDLLVRRRRSPVAVGAALGVLLAVQFFVGTEVLVMVVVFGAVGVVLVAGYALVGRRHRAVLVAHAPHALRGLVTAGVAGGVLLAYPVWFALAGPAHFSGLVWPTLPAGTGGISLGDLWHLSSMTALRRQMLATGGYQGPALPTAGYVGFGILVVVVAGCLAWRRDRRLWCFGALGVVAVVLSLGLQSYWTPWRVLAHVPLLQNVIPGRMMAVVDTCLAVMVGVVVDRTYGSVRGAVLRLGAGAAARPTAAGGGTMRRYMPAPGHGAGGATGAGATDGAAAGRSVTPGAVRTVADITSARPSGADADPVEGAARARRTAGVAGSLAALGVAAVALVPMAGALASNVPLTAVPVSVPRWFTVVAPHLPPGQVVLAYPAPFALEQSAEDWQAVDGLRFALVGGSGPGSVLTRAGPERAGQAVVGAASFSLDGPPSPSAAHVDAVRRALAGWGVTWIVVPDPATLPRYERGTNAAAAVGLFTLAVGRPPAERDGAWVWSGVGTPSPTRSIADGAFTSCTASPDSAAPPHLAVPDCVMASSRPAP